MDRYLGSEGSQVESLGVPQGKRTAEIFDGEQTGFVAFLQQTPVAAQIAIVGRVDGVVARIVAKLEREERRRPPRNVGVHVNLVAEVAQMSESSTADGTQIGLRTRRQMHEPGDVTGKPVNFNFFLFLTKQKIEENSPKFVLGGRLGRADQLVRRGAQKISAARMSQSPASAVLLRHHNLQPSPVVLLVRIARHVAVLEHEKKNKKK